MTPATLAETGEPAEVHFEPSGSGDLVARLAGAWTLDRPRPAPSEIVRALEARPARRIVLDAAGVTSWDTALLAWVTAQNIDTHTPRATREKIIELDRVIEKND